MEVPFTPGKLLAGRYRLLARIGEGGFGTVYQARDQRKHGALVAIKAISMEALSAQEKIEATDSFNREIMVLSQLRHTSLPRLFDQFTDADHWYLVMEYIEGQTLEDLLASSHSKKRGLPIRQVVWIGCLLCDVLSYLHEQDPPIIFRDVKPGNIMLAFWGRIYLIDFGIARRYRPGQRRDTGTLGSPGYAAPEQYGSGQTTALTDIYGLGATLQTLLTGKEPLEIRLHGLPPDLHLPAPLQELIRSMLDPDPGRRPQQLDEVKEVLVRCGGGGFFLAVCFFRMPRWFYVVYGLLLFLEQSITLWHLMSQSGFIQSLWFLPSLFLVLALVVGFWWRDLRKARRKVQARLSAKTIVSMVGMTVYLVPFLAAGIIVLGVFLAGLLKGQLWLVDLGVLPGWLSFALSLMGCVMIYQWFKQWSEIRRPHRAQQSPQPLSTQQQQQKRQT